MSEALKAAVARQRMLLSDRLAQPMAALAEECAACWVRPPDPDLRDSDSTSGRLPDSRFLEQRLGAGLSGLTDLQSCKYLYVLDAEGVQLTANLTHSGPLPEHRGRDRRDRPYLAAAFAGEVFSLSDAYISRNARRPSLTAVQRIRAPDGELLGFLGADFDLRELPLTRQLCGQPEQWVQLKGDPSIRGGLFAQQRVESLMDRRIDDVLDLMVELIAVHGVFHGKLHFSSSRATVWLLDDPYRYRLLDFEDLSDPGICLAYGRRPYPPEAAIPLDRVREVFRSFRALRFMDENIYLRSGSLNIFNGMVGLNFSCDGSHYMPWSEYLDKSLGFWTGDEDLCGPGGACDA